MFFCLKKANIVTLWYPSVGTPFAVSEFSHCSQVLSRHQFLEMLLRVADQRYVQTGPAAECCRSTWTVQLFPRATGLFFWWNMGLQTDEHWRYMDIFRLTLNGNGYIGTFPSLFGCQSMTCPVFLAHCPISNSGFWLGTCSDMISCLIYCGKPTHKESQTSLQIWIHRHTQKSNPD